MASIDDEFELMLDDCADAFGDEVTIRIKTDGAWDPSTGVTPANVDAITVLVVRQPERIDMGSGGQADVRATEFRAMVSELQGYSVKAGDEILDADGETLWRIWSTELEVNGKQLLMRCRTVEKRAVPGA
jgi:hypothetical protein